MKIIIARWGLAATLWLAAAPLQAAIVFYADQAAFTAAMAASGSTFIGTETFEENTAVSGSLVRGPLTQGVARDVFPSGLLQPMTVHVLEPTFVVPSQSGRGRLLLVPAGERGNLTDVLVAAIPGDALDWLFGSPLDGVGFNPISVDQNATLEIEVYNASGVLLASTTTSADPAGATFLGIQATGGDRIGRINFFSTATVAPLEGGDNATLFQIGGVPAPVPEPTPIALLALGLAAIAASRRRVVTSRL
jgi:hypothetical protein